MEDEEKAEGGAEAGRTSAGCFGSGQAGGLAVSCSCLGLARRPCRDGSNTERWLWDLWELATIGMVKLREEASDASVGENSDIPRLPRRGSAGAAGTC